jgi:ATP-dependent DNA helicase RecQ
LPPLPAPAQLEQWCRALRQEDGTPLSAHSLACFLCGISTPLLNRLKARGKPGFGALERQRFGEVVSLVTP